MILCCGEALIDMIPEPTVSGASGFVPHCGGAIFNTAIALGRLGASAGLLTGLSRDMFGQQLTASLTHSGVDTSHAIYSDRPTTLAFVKLTDGQARYTFMDENSAGRMLTPSDLPGIQTDVCALYFGGISLACEPCGDAYAALSARESADRLVMLDPNIRPAFIADAARYRDRLSGMIAQADMLKISDEDLDWVIEGPGTHEDKAKSMLERGPSVVILTKGAEGATAYLQRGTEVHVPAQSAQVVDTVGAGDTFNAGVLASLSQAGWLRKDRWADVGDEQIRDALTLGAQVAGITVSRAGANPPWAHELTGHGV